MQPYFFSKDFENDLPYTDLACERRRVNTTVAGIDYKREIGLGGIWERIKISSEEGARSIGRPIGIYDTLELERMDRLDDEEIEDAADEVARELCYLFDVAEVIPDKLLIVGLGNPTLTPDAVGAESAKRVKPTMHIKEMDEHAFRTLECSEIAVTTPGVAATSGMDAYITIRGICDTIDPDAVIIVDALAARSPERLGKTIQICNTGILPGGGLGNARIELNQKSLGAPTIAIGVPTVINSRAFKDGESSLVDGMFVSPKEIGQIVSAAGKIIGGGINQAFGVF